MFSSDGVTVWPTWETTRMIASKAKPIEKIYFLLLKPAFSYAKSNWAYPAFFSRLVRFGEIGGLFQFKITWNFSAIEDEFSWLSGWSGRNQLRILCHRTPSNGNNQTALNSYRVNVEKETNINHRKQIWTNAVWMLSGSSSGNTCIDWNCSIRTVAMQVNKYIEKQ